MSICRVFSCVVGRRCLLWPVCSLGRILLAFAMFHSVLQGQTWPVTPGIFWLPPFAFQSPVMKRTSFFDASSKRSYRSTKNHSTSASLSLVVGSQTWITVILSCLPWKWTEIILSFLRLHSSTVFRTPVDYESYSIPSKWFLPTVVDIMVTWVKFDHSSPF